MLRTHASAKTAIRHAALFLAVSAMPFIAGVAWGQDSAAVTPEAPATLPLTSKSPEAQRLVVEAMRVGLDLVEQENCDVMLRQAIKLDPDFAMAHELLAQNSLDPGEQVIESARAFALRNQASPAERLVIEWWQDAIDHKLISAITKMNDLLGQYPHDKWVVFMTTNWLITQTQFDRAIAVYERSGITDSAGLLNNVGYTYAYMREFDKAFALMDKYVDALPKDANPQDSYAEILRMAGSFNKALEHYRAALAIDPQFYSSQFGIADTYSLMGDQVRARQEYEVAFQKFPLPELHLVQWRTREAETFIREGDLKGADRAFQAIAEDAHAKHMSQVEADAYRQMAMYQPDPRQASQFLSKADTVLKEGKNSMPAAIHQEQAQILRARVEAALKAGDRHGVHTLLVRLSEMAASSNDRLIDSAYQGAAGAAAFSRHKYDDAISHLEEDKNNPLSLKLLAAAYEKIGYSAGAKRTNDTLANLNDPSLEQALVVPAFRKCYEDPTCAGGDMRPVSLKK
ncbi:MAG: tetratricopeptide repeat protein [Terriglobales bacterium]